MKIDKTVKKEAEKVRKEVDKGAKVVERVGRFNGSTAWVNVRRHYELTGHSIRDQLRKEIDAFAPLASETPDSAFDRLDDLLQDYQSFPTATPFTNDDQIKMYLSIARRFAALDIKVRMIQSSLSSGERPPHRSSCEYIINELLGEWLSFGASEETLPIHLGVIHPGALPPTSPESDLTARLQVLEATVLATQAQLKIAQAAAGAHLGKGKGAHPGSPNPKPSPVLVNLGPCQGVGCSAIVQAPEYIKVRVLCQLCYESVRHIEHHYSPRWSDRNEGPFEEPEAPSPHHDCHFSICFCHSWHRSATPLLSSLA